MSAMMVEALKGCDVIVGCNCSIMPNELSTSRGMVGVDWHPGVVLEGVGFAVEVDEVCVPVAIGVLRELPAFHVDGLVTPPRLGSTWRENRLEGDVAGKTLQNGHGRPDRQ
ncbi:hypothetical protein OUZ56_003184 [Daphnia magna]|uniref:Uncharacterized protein n=1 Tax=Daphnia magna TaxID=35525 RepID=A0ABQ9Z9T4_9CRUS|nr:hypothetical protein OUZ56_005794 [Daphnia magna]KAK4009664.1 hypothetical protein OUZ56_018810 [Daphnia magna]KAK4021265.1 hypothetical protein OUZ56_003184 [Daphnia magna]